MQIVKRSNTGSDNYYVRFEFRGKAYLRSTGTSNKAAATTIGKQIVQAIKTGDVEQAERMKLRNDYASVAEILERYRARAAEELDVKHKTVLGNVSALRAILLEVMGPDTDLIRVKANELTAELVERFKDARKAKAKGFAQVEKMKRTVNSTMTQARCVVSAAAMKLYRDLKMPDLSGFRAVKKWPLSQSMEYRPIPAQVLVEMERAAKEELREKKPALYLGYLMALRLGMRDCEIVAAKWDWVEEWPSGPQMAIITREDFEPKGAEGRVPIARDVIHELTAYGNPDPKGFILPLPSMTGRKNAIYRELSAWVRKFLPDREKSLHELRKHAGSVVLTRTRSLAHAKKFLRHRSVATTEQHYATLLDELPALDSSDWRGKEAVA